MEKEDGRAAARALTVATVQLGMVLSSAGKLPVRSECIVSQP